MELAEYLDQLTDLFNPDEIRRRERWSVGEELCCLIGSLMLKDMEAGKLLGKQLNAYLKHLI